MQAETQQVLDETLGRIYPIQFVQVGKLHNVPVALVRVSTCGGLQLEVLREVTRTDPHKPAIRSSLCTTVPKAAVQASPY